MRRMTAYLSALLLLLTLAACGGTSDLVGTYTLQRITAGGGTVDAAALSQAAQEAGLSFQVTLELRDDGTFRLASSTSADVLAGAAHWAHQLRRLPLSGLLLLRRQPLPH